MKQVSQSMRDCGIAVLDWLKHHSQVLLFEGWSYLFRESVGRLSEPRHKTE